jgi:hypothetical protein
VNRSRITGLVATVSALGALTAATIGSSVTAEARPAAGQNPAVALARTEVHVEGRTVTLPASLHPGLRFITVTATKAREAAFLHLKTGYTVDQAVADANAAFGNQTDVAAVNRFYDNTVIGGGIVGSPSQSGVGVVTLTRGQWYALVPSFPLAVSQLTPFMVEGAKVATPRPDYSATITALSDKVWDRTPASIPTKGLLHFRNKAQSPHFLEIDQLAPGKTYHDFKNWVQLVISGKQAPPPFGKASTFTGVISPGHSSAFKYQLPKGKYVVVCFMPDR